MTEQVRSALASLSSMGPTALTSLFAGGALLIMVWSGEQRHDRTMAELVKIAGSLLVLAEHSNQTQEGQHKSMMLMAEMAARDDKSASRANASLDRLADSLRHIAIRATQGATP